MANTAAENVHPKISCSDLPGIFQAADAIAVEGQQRYTWLFRLDLILLVAASGLFFVAALLRADYEKSLYFFIAIVYCATAVTTLQLRTSHSKSKWYKGRALAESARTTFWRYITRADCDDIQDCDPDEIFYQRIEELLGQIHSLGIDLPASHASKPVISPTMRDVRSLDWQDRLKVYLQDRVRDQSRWYAIKAKQNQADRKKWLGAAFLSQVVAALFAAAAGWGLSWAPGTPGVFSATATALLAWLQLKQYDNLSQAYAIAASELSLAGERAEKVDSESSLARYVASTESLMSREHTLWVSRGGR